MTVVPLFCAKLIKSPHLVAGARGIRSSRLRAVSSPASTATSKSWCGNYDRIAERALAAAGGYRRSGWLGVSLSGLSLYPLLGVAYFPRTDPGQFVINLKAPSGTRIELTEQDVKQVEDKIRESRSRQRTGNDRFQHRGHARLFGDLHAELGAAHRVSSK